MTTPKPVALPELPLKKFFVDGEAWAYTDKQMHDFALSAIAMHRAEVERLRLLVRQAYEEAWVDFQLYTRMADGWESSHARAALKETP